MNKIDLKREVREFTNGLLGKNSTESMCYIVGAPLEGYLRAIGYDARLVEGYVGGDHHWWIELEDGTIVDPTADQFKENGFKPMPKNYVGPKPKRYALIPQHSERG